MLPNLVNFGLQTAEKRLASFCPPIKFARRTSCRLTFATHFGLIIFVRWRLWSTQMPRTWLALVRLRAVRSHDGLCHASSFWGFGVSYSTNTKRYQRNSTNGTSLRGITLCDERSSKSIHRLIRYDIFTENSIWRPPPCCISPKVVFHAKWCRTMFYI